MKHNSYILFLISECLNGHTKIPVHTFISNDYDTAKLYFHDWLYGKKCKAKFNLYKIAEIQKDLSVKESKAYITSGFEYGFKESLREEKRRIEEASKEKDIKEQIKKLWDGIDVK